MFRRIYASVYAPIKWARAYDQAVKKQYHLAVRTLEDAYKVLGAETNYQRAPYDFNLLLGSLLCRTDNEEKALDILVTAREQIRSDARLSEIDKDYLTTHCNHNIWYAAERLGRDSVVSAPDLQRKFAKSQLSRVTSVFLRVFPLAPECLS